MILTRTLLAANLPAATLLAAVGIAAVAPTAAFANAETAQGLKLAQTYCVECHMVTPSSKSGWTDAPAFTAVANRPGSTVASLAAIIEKPHMKMLNTGRPPAEAKAIAAYIMTLRTRP